MSRGFQERTVRRTAGAARVRALRAFTWSCRKAVIENGHLAEAHDIISTDRTEFERHMRGHGLQPLKPTQEAWKPWTAPRPGREYQPKPMDPGQHVEWVKVTPGHWEGRDWNNPAASPGQWVEGTRETRAGIVWSTADVATAWYVQPDDNPARPVYVKRAGKRERWEHPEGTLYEIPGVAEAARANVLRGEIVRRQGIFPVIATVVKAWNLGAGRGQDEIYVEWHCDPSCPRAAGKEHYDHASHGYARGYFYGGGRDFNDGPWTPLRVAQALTSSSQAPNCLCPDCIIGIPIADGPATGPASGPPGGPEPAAGATQAAAAPVGGELAGDSPYRAALAALDGYTGTAARMAEATQVLEAQLTIHGLDRDQAVMRHIGALGEAAGALQSHVWAAHTGLTGRHAAGAEYHASGGDASASAFRTTGGSSP